ncbi:multiheme c-type cytochrome [Desulfuribacillus alkaliarsenatis]|uniref:Cytochrome c-552/4 domain-containing protein n=1 Tax=Desulfuribacillus alkaliarsenatis TaxID=766136 RepID=A0A1E5G545_9FIRM|nr:multiheme c-type cytochrome [Desulfuribacillus alkaliarsenatis]OEF98302.1 hypothetical protein BHF68_01070 [Desulfuribacillus alkaliarsenatis]
MSKNRLLVLMAMLVIAALVVVGCADEVATPDPAPAPAPDQPVTPDPVATDHRTVYNEYVSGFTGPDACQMCHQDQYKKWETSWHTIKITEGPARLGGSLENIWEDVVPQWDELDTYVILDQKDRNTLYISTEKVAIEDVEFVVGATRKQRYMVYYDGGPREAWLSTTEDGGISWTIDKSQTVQFEGNLDRAGYKLLAVEMRGFGASIYSYGEHRSWQERCIACHVTGFDAYAWEDALEEYKNGEREDLRDFFAADLRISCEACHGPGADHAANPMAEGKIINPAKLSYDDPTRKMVCEQCHTRTGGKNKFDLSQESNDLRGFMLGTHDYLDVQDYVRPAWGTGNRATSIDGKGRRDHQHDMDIRLQDYIFERQTVHGQQACFDCHDSHNVGNDPNNKSIKGSQPVDACIACHGDKSEDYMKVLNGRTGWSGYGFGNWDNEGGRTGHSQHIFNFDEEGRSFGLSPEQYTWALKSGGNAADKADWVSIWPWEASYFEGKGQQTFTGAEPWNQ